MSRSAAGIGSGKVSSQNRSHLDTYLARVDQAISAQSSFDIKRASFSIPPVEVAYPDSPRTVCRMPSVQACWSWFWRRQCPNVVWCLFRIGLWTSTSLVSRSTFLVSATVRATVGQTASVGSVYHSSVPVVSFLQFLEENWMKDLIVYRDHPNRIRLAKCESLWAGQCGARSTGVA